MYKVPTSFTAARALVINGVAVAKNAVLTPTQVAGMRTLQSLLAKRWVYPTPDPTARRTASRPTPTYVSPGALKKYFGQSLPEVPFELAAVAGDTEVVLSWSENDGPEPDFSDFVVQYKAHSSNTWLTFNDGVDTATSATVTGLTNDTQYDFRVKATNSNGTSAASTVVSATPVAPPAPEE